MIVCFCFVDVLWMLVAVAYFLHAALSSKRILWQSTLLLNRYLMLMRP